MPPLLNVEHLKVWFPKQTDFFGKPMSWVKAVDDVCFQLHEGETIGLVGESGSGKTTTGLATLRAYNPRGGKIEFCPDGKTVHELSTLTQNQLQPLRRHMQMIFQDPFSSLNPRMTVQQLITEPLKVNKVGKKSDWKNRVSELLEEVGLSQSYMRRYPHAFSGGQRQRIVIARALALNPKMIVCDEAVSALDVSVQAQILNLMIDLKTRYNLAYIFVAHDLEVVRHISDRVAVMYAGRLVEDGTKQQVLEEPMHPYTQSLLASSPKPDPTRNKARAALKGEVPDPSNLPSGCVFHPRCPRAMKCCANVVPSQLQIDGRNIRCLLYDKEVDDRSPLHPS